MDQHNLQELKYNIFDGINWNNATKRAEIARKMFQDLLEF